MLTIENICCFIKMKCAADHERIFSLLSYLILVTKDHARFSPELMPILYPAIRAIHIEFIFITEETFNKLSVYGMCVLLQ